jgi:alkylation response protein AidB-like acyl-CoA dehydrogenase
MASNSWGSPRVARIEPPGRSSRVPSAPALKELLSAANELVPTLRDRALDTEEERRVSQQTIAEFRAAGFFRLMQPAAFGGYEYGFSALLDLITALGRGCTSSAWNCGIAVSHQWLIGGFPLQAQQDVWSENSDAIACASYAPTGHADPVEDGQLIHGRWQFVSNVDNSDWAILGINLPAAERRFPPEASFVLVPRAAWAVEDDWHVAGQCGTGSKSIVIAQPTFVPAHRRLPVSVAAAGSFPGGIPFLSALPVCLVAPLLGTALGAIEQFTEHCRSRITRGAVGGAGVHVSEFYPVQSRVAEASALADAAQLLIQRDIAEVEYAVASGRSLTLDERIRNRRDHAFAARLARQAVDVLFQAVGGEGLALDHPIQRMWRDANAIVRHITLNWDAVSAMVGQHLLGLVPKGQY